MSRLTSSFTYQLISIIITTLIIYHSFSLSLQTQNLPFQQILPTLIRLLPWTTFTIMEPDQTYHASRFIFSSFFFFNFSVCSVWWTELATRQLFGPTCGGLSWLHVSFLLHAKYTVSYRIVQYRKPWIIGPTMQQADIPLPQSATSGLDSAAHTRQAIRPRPTQFPSR